MFFGAHYSHGDVGFPRLGSRREKVLSQSQYGQHEVSSLVTMLIQAPSIEEQADILHYLVLCYGPHHKLYVNQLSKEIAIRDLMSTLYETALVKKNWAIVRQAAGFLGKRVEDLSKAVTDLLVRQKQVTVGLPLANNEVIVSGGAALKSRDLILIIYNAYRGDESMTMLTQELLVYLSMFIQTEPQLFHGMMRKNLITLIYLDTILKKGISASTLNLFIKNPYLFYEQKILGINDFEDTKYLNYMDQGTLIHKVIEKIYEPYIGLNLEIKHIDSMKKELVNESVNSFTELYSKEPQGKNLIFIEVLKEYINNTLDYERDQLENQKAQIKIISLEQKISTNLKVKNNDVKLNGIIDRIDLFNGELRIIDYKSGSVKQGVLDLKNIENIKKDYKYSYLLQLLFYKYLAASFYENKEIKDVGICYLKKRNSPFQFISNHSTLSLDEIQKILSDVILNILETNEFIDSGNPL